MTVCLSVPSLSTSTQTIGDQNALQGRWRVAALAGEMASALAPIIGHGTIAVSGDTMTMRGVGNGDDASDRFLFTLDTVPSPRHIDLVAMGSADGEAWTGSYRVAADTLALMLPVEHGDGRIFRPETFDAPKTLVFILQREKP